VSATAASGGSRGGCGDRGLRDARMCSALIHRVKPHTLPECVRYDSYAAETNNTGPARRGRPSRAAVYERRSSQFTMLLHLPPMNGRAGPRVKNGPALAGHGAQAVRDAIAEVITRLPEQLRRSLTWDQGVEMASTRGCESIPAYPAQPMAARHQREHQRDAAPVLPEGDRPGQAHRRRARSRRRHTERSAEENRLTGHPPAALLLTGAAGAGVSRWPFDLRDPTRGRRLPARGWDGEMVTTPRPER